MVRRVVAALVLGWAIAACGSGTTGAPEDLCINRVLTAVLTVDSDDPRVIWATNAATGQDIDVRLPGGFGVTPEDQVVNEDGRVIAVSGDIIEGGCSDLLQDALLIDEADIRREP